jgi:hypothetical protein
MKFDMKIVDAPLSDADLIEIKAKTGINIESGIAQRGQYVLTCTLDEILVIKALLGKVEAKNEHTTNMWEVLSDNTDEYPDSYDVEVNVYSDSEKALKITDIRSLVVNKLR